MSEKNRTYIVAEHYFTFVCKRCGVEEEVFIKKQKEFDIKKIYRRFWSSYNDHPRKVLEDIEIKTEKFEFLEKARLFDMGYLRERLCEKCYKEYKEWFKSSVEHP